MTAERRTTSGAGSLPAKGPFVVAVEASRLMHDKRGIGRYVRALLPRILALRMDLRLILFVRRRRDVAAVRGVLNSFSIPVERVEIRLRGEMNDTRADVFWYPWNIAIPAPKRGAVVATMHDVAPLVYPDPRWWRWPKNRRWRNRYRETVNRATLLLTVSEFSAMEIVRVLGFARDRIRVTLPAADDVTPPAASRDVEALRRLGVRPPFFLVVGAAERRKNLSLLERAMPSVVEAFPQARLVLAGPRRSASADEPSWRQTLGFVSDEDLVSLYRSARALITPSSYEGFGLPVLEALRLGTPVICARATSLPEVAGDAAMYVGVQDDEALASAAKRLLGDDALHAQLRVAALAQSARFSWEETARQTLAAFEEAAAIERDSIALAASR